MMTTPKSKGKQRSASLKAMDYLARRDHSEKELREKLAQHYEPEEIDHALAYVINHGWLLPPHELSEKVSESLNRKKKSHFFIINYLRKKGLPPVKKNEDTEQEKALAVLELKAKDISDYTYLHSLLKNRGFDTDTIRKVINEIRRDS